MKLAVIDCGTNTFHLLVVEMMPDGQIQRLFKERRYVRLGQDGLNRIGETPFRRGLECLRYFKGKLLELGVIEVCVFGTEALRRASNGADFIAAAQAETGIKIQLITGDEEARLIHLGVMQAAPDFAGKGLIMDVGGGSVEFVIASREEVFWARSFPVGVQVLFSNFHHNDPIASTERQALNAFLEENLQPLFIELKKHDTPHLLGASGSFEVVEDLLRPQRPVSPHTIVSTREFYQIYEKVMASTLAERRQMAGIPEERSELIVVAFGLIDFVLQKAGTRQIITSAYAMKEGMLLEMAGRVKELRIET